MRAVDILLSTSWSASRQVKTKFRQPFSNIMYMMNIHDAIENYCSPILWPDLKPSRLASRIIDLHRERDFLDKLEPQAFAAAGHNFCGIGLLGLADDAGVHLNGGRPGAAGGPNAFRTALSAYGAADSVALQDFNVPLVDLGNIIPGDSLTETHARVTETVAAMLTAGLMPIGIGGGHDLTFPEVRAVIDNLTRPNGQTLAGVYFDAHLDVREDEGSGMPFRRLIEHGGIGGLQLFGFDPLSNTPAHLEWFEDHGGERVDWPPTQWPPSQAQFVSICLDVIDMAQAPGVSAPHPAGWSAQRLADYAEAAGRMPSVCCFDIMELSPPFDEAARTARLAVYLFMRFLAGLNRRPKT
ncbi:MAG: arginase family protein [Wenzhouxiangellaceae bacterium]|nr:arginase family protein [Wenzhouxiangellaceae bacterium]